MSFLSWVDKLPILNVFSPTIRLDLSSIYNCFSFNQSNVLSAVVTLVASPNLTIKSINSPAITPVSLYSELGLVP